MKTKYLDALNCKALLPKDEYDIVFSQLEDYLEKVNVGDSGHKGLVDTLIKYNKDTKKKKYRLLDSQNMVDVCLSVFAESGNNKVRTLNSVVGVVYREPCKLHLEYNNENGTYWKVIIPLQFLLKGWGEADKGYQCYFHTIVENIKPAKIARTSFGTKEIYPEPHEPENIKEYTYFGITGRNWLKRLTEHLREIRTGSNKRFHKAWREFFGIQDVLYTSTLMFVNLSYEDAMNWEEKVVDHQGTVLSPYILNMIPGGFKGLRELHKLGITSRVNITLKEREKAIEEYVNRFPRKGVPAPWMKEYWENYENYKNYINKRSDTLSDDEVRKIRALARDGIAPEEILELIPAARNLRQVKDVICRKYYDNVED